MLDFLKQEEAKKADDNPIFFEVDYALNVCKQKEKDYKKELEEVKKKSSEANEKKEVSIKDLINQMKKAQIILYAILGLHDKAVKLALECDDVKMAMQYADKPSEKKVRKKLWMKIAKYLFNY